MSTRHTITAQPNILFTFPGFDGHESAQPTIDVTYTYVPGAPATHDDPGWAPEVSIVSATLINGDGLDPTPQQVHEWAQNWLDDEGYDFACHEAESNSGPDPDEAYERARDDARDFPYSTEGDVA